MRPWRSRLTNRRAQPDCMIGPDDVNLDEVERISI